MNEAAALPVTFADIEAAKSAIAGAVLHTPTVAAPALSAIIGADLALKLETLHATGSFKERGALTKLLSLDAKQRAAGVVAMSAGNHAQGVAYHARRLGIPATIVMPEGTPFTKIERTEAQGARIILRGAGLNEAQIAATDLVVAEGLTLVHPYNDPLVIAGQGTVGLELLRDRTDLDVLLVPIGGGGLISGIAVAAKTLAPKLSIVGVQSALYPDMAHALGRCPPGTAGATLAEGIAVKSPGELTRRIIGELIDDILLVGETALERAVAMLLDVAKLVVEGAGAAPLAALLDQGDRFRGRRVGLILSGGNIDARLLASLLQRDLIRTGRLVRLRVEISDVPGALARIAGIIGGLGGNIVEIYHQRLFYDVPIKLAEVDIVVETRNAVQVGDILAAFSAAGWTARLLSNTAIS